jgi:hypothetical protein
MRSPTRRRGNIDEEHRPAARGVGEFLLLFAFIAPHRKESNKKITESSERAQEIGTTATSLVANTLERGRRPKCQSNTTQEGRKVTAEE